MELGPNLFLSSGAHPNDIRADVVVIAVIRDEMWRMPFFLAYHRWLGVQHFIIIDNRSCDGTSDFLAREPDVTCMHAPGNYGGDPKGQTVWIRWALRLAPPRRWNLVLDADELFVGAELQRNSLLALTRNLSREGAAILVTSLVDCYPATLSFSENFEPVPWRRAPYFDVGPYFVWPARSSIRYIQRGVRQRVCWPHWRRIQWLKKVVPRPFRTHHFRDSPPAVFKMPLLRNVPGLNFRNVHESNGAPRSKHLFALLHYKLDLDLAKKVPLALAERQYWQGSRQYRSYGRLIEMSDAELRFEGTRVFTGVQSLVDAQLVYSELELGALTADAETNVDALVDEIWACGDYALQQRVWITA